MINPELGQFLIWRSRLAKIVGLSSGPHVTIEMQEDNKCPHCGESLGREQVKMVTNAPIFQDESQPVPTIEK